MNNSLYKPGVVCKIRGSDDDWVIIGSVYDGLVNKITLKSRFSGEITHRFNFELNIKHSGNSYTDVTKNLKRLAGIDTNENFDFLFTDYAEDQLDKPECSKPKRFKDTTNDKINQLKKQNTEKTTDTSTKWAVGLFRTWLAENTYEQSFEQLEITSLNNFLEQFYASLQTQKGENYSKSALVGIRSGLNRHLTSPPYSRLLNIMNDRDFMTSNQVLTGLIKGLKRDGNDLSKHKDPISEEDHKKLYECGVFSEKTATTLQNKVLYEIIAQFGRRGREGLHLLRKNSFRVKQDSKGRRFLTMTFNEADKTHHGIDSREISKEPRMYESGGDFCPLKSFELYLSKLNSMCDRLFQRPCRKFNYNLDVWYENSPLGLNRINSFMARLSSETALSQRYTNHCIRAFVATHLHHKGFGNDAIMSITGHRNVQSLCSYVKPHDDEKLSVSNALAYTKSSNSPVQVPAANDSQNLQVQLPPANDTGLLTVDVESEKLGQNIQMSSNSLHMAGREIRLFSGSVQAQTINVNFYNHDKSN